MRIFGLAASLSCPFLASSIYFPCPQLSPFLTLNIINHELLHLIHNLCPHLSRSTPLHKTLAADHYFRNGFFANGVKLRKFE